MNPNLNSGENLTELVFENKNKAYGAYALRASQGENVTYSVMTTSLLFMFFAILAFWLSNKKVDLSTDDGNIPPTWKIQDVIVEKKDPVEPQKVEKKVEKAIKSTSGEYKADDHAKNEDQKINEDQNISKNPNPKGVDTVEKKDPVIPIIIEKKVPKTPVLYAKKMPVLANMNQFIADNLKYPSVAVDEGISGTVYITFVVETDGSITDVKPLKGIGAGCEEEAMRVVRMMPKWEPGQDENGEPVRVQCNLPVRFRIK
jgi:protein TonB